MIEKYYAAHLRTKLYAAAINIMRPRPKKMTNSKKGPGHVWMSALWLPKCRSSLLALEWADSKPQLGMVEVWSRSYPPSGAAKAEVV
jgi:hypothetical protein